jgi:hypothetical protein
LEAIVLNRLSSTEHASVSGKRSSGSSKNYAGKISENGGKLSKRCHLLQHLLMSVHRSA